MRKAIMTIVAAGALLAGGADPVAAVPVGGVEPIAPIGSACVPVGGPVAPGGPTTQSMCFTHVGQVFHCTLPNNLNCIRVARTTGTRPKSRAPRGGVNVATVQTAPAR